MPFHGTLKTTLTMLHSISNMCAIQEYLAISIETNEHTQFPVVLFCTVRLHAAKYAQSEVSRLTKPATGQWYHKAQCRCKVTHFVAMLLQYILLHARAYTKAELSLSFGEFLTACLWGHRR